MFVESVARVWGLGVWHQVGSGATEAYFTKEGFQNHSLLFWLTKGGSKVSPGTVSQYRSSYGTVFDTFKIAGPENSTCMQGSYLLGCQVGRNGCYDYP